jgi:hypothetical protein
VRGDEDRVTVGGARLPVASASSRARCSELSNETNRRCPPRNRVAEANEMFPPPYAACRDLFERGLTERQERIVAVADNIRRLVRINTRVRVVWQFGG